VVAAGATVETVDYFRRWIQSSPQHAEEYLFMVQILVIATVWSVLGLLLVWQGYRQKARPVYYFGFWLVILGLATACLRGFSFVPIESFTPVANLRAALLALHVAVALILVWLARESRGVFGWAGDLADVSRYIPALVLLVLCSIETWTCSAFS